MITINTAKFADTVLVVGGQTSGGSTEILYNPSCNGISTLDRYNPVSISTGSLSLVCGGESDDDSDSLTSCQQFNADTKTFSPHSQLLQPRYAASGVSTSQGIIIVGGFYSGNTIEMLATDSTTWTARTDITGSGVSYSCMTMLNHSHAIVVGGSSALTAVRLYDVINDQWTDLPSLDVGVWCHDCINTEQGVLVAGGRSGGDTGDSTERSVLIDPVTGLVETVGSLNVAREGHKLVKIGDSDTIVSVAGSGSSGRLTSIEEWVPATKTWTMSSLSLNVARSFFGVLTIPVPVSDLCD